MKPRYVTFQLERMVLPCLNMCVGSNPGEIEGPGIVHCDIERWRYQNFVQCDVHHLPFKSNAFATVLSGDCLEHFVDPIGALKEMRRVGKRTILTTFVEWRLPGPGQYIAEGQRLFARVPQVQPRLLECYPEEKMSHLPHINQWSGPEELETLFRLAGFVVREFESDCPGVHEGHPMQNLCFTLERA